MRTMALLFSALVVLAVLSGCGKKDEPATTTETPTGTGGTMTSPTTSPTNGTGSPTPAPEPKDLPKVTINLMADGSAQTGSTTIDNGTMMLAITIWLNVTGVGPYAAAGPGGSGDVKVEFTEPGGAAATKTVTLTGTANTAGAYAGTGSLPNEGPFEDSLSHPKDGPWAIKVLGQGTNMHIDIYMTETFTM